LILRPWPTMPHPASPSIYRRIVGIGLAEPLAI
jgi:hypothetical protein